MKFRQSIVVLICAGFIWSGCASAPPHPGASSADSAATTNTVADGETADESPESTALSAGKGNAPSLAHFAAGQSYEANGKHEQAREEFYLSVMADPANEAEALELCKQYLQQQHPEKAVALLTKVCQRPDASAVILAWLARADLLAGKTSDAVAASNRAMQRWPEALDGYQSALEAMAPAGKTADMLKTLDRAAKHVRSQPSALISLAELYSACLKRPDPAATPARLRALGLLDRVAGMKITSGAVWERLADAYAALGEAKKASAIYTKLLEDPAAPPVARNQLQVKIGLNYMDQKDWTNALKQFRAVVKDDPIRFPIAWYYLGILAEADIKADNAATKMAEAADDFEHALRWGQAPEMAYYRLALLRADMDLADEAQRVLDQAREKFGAGFENEFYNAMVRTRLRDYDEAVKHFGAAEEIARSNSPARLDRDFYFQTGSACERAKQYQRAADYLKKCIDLKPDDAESLNYLGFMWADRGENLAKARAYIEKAVSLDPKNAAYLDSLGWVFYKLKQPREALPWMLKAVEFSEEPDATILDHLGDVYLALGQPEKALENWRKSLAVEANDEVKKKLRAFDAGAT